MRIPGPSLAACLLFLVVVPGGRVAEAQVPFAGEVRQLVTLSFLPGRSGEATRIFRELAVPRYREDEAMRAFRGFREIESPIPLDLIVVSSFEGMAGMDRSNAELGALGIGEFYRAIGPLLASHHDQFVEMLPDLGSGDPSSSARTALVWYRIRPDRQAAFEEAVAEVLVPWERAGDVPSATGRFLLSDGWHFLRFLGFESLGAYQAYWRGLAGRPGYGDVAEIVAERREVIVAGVPELTVR